jgi:hypothetical protein
MPLHTQRESSYAEFCYIFATHIDDSLILHTQRESSYAESCYIFATHIDDSLIQDLVDMKPEHAPGILPMSTSSWMERWPRWALGVSSSTSCTPLTRPTWSSGPERAGSIYPWLSSGPPRYPCTRRTNHDGQLYRQQPDRLASFFFSKWICFQNSWDLKSQFSYIASRENNTSTQISMLRSWENITRVHKDNELVNLGAVSKSGNNSAIELHQLAKQ